MKKAAPKRDFGWPFPATVVRRWRSLALAALVLGLALSTTPSFSQSVNPIYNRYNSALLLRYFNDDILVSTLDQLWLGEKPTDDELHHFALLKSLALMPRPSPLAIPALTTSQYTLSSSTPILPFAGNQLVVLGAAVFANNTNLSAVAFRRQGDCTLIQDVFEPVNNLLTPTSVAEVPDAQGYLHELSGLTTTPDLFPQGCTDPTLGTTAVFTAQPVGVTANNLDLVAQLTSNGALVVQKIDIATNTSSTVTLAPGNVLAFLVADVNGDGLNDIVASNVTDPATGASSFATFLNNGDGTFGKPAYADAPGTILFTVDDVNGDGKPDIVFSSVQFGDEGPIFTVTTLPGNADGTFNAGVSSPTSAGGSTLVTGDFNGDGRKDLLLGGAVLLGAGNGTFKAGPALPFGVEREAGLSPSAAVGDLNQDGNLDIVYSGVIGGSGIVQILLGKGDGTFQIGARYASLTPVQHVTLTDIDGDGNPDIFVGNSSQGLYGQDSNDDLSPMMQFLLGRGDGTFVGAPVYTRNSVSQLVTGDFNGDSKPDALTFMSITSASGTTTTALAVLPGDGSGKLGDAITSPVNLRRASLVATAVNHDGKLDAVLAGFSNAGAVLSVFMNQGDGTFGGEHDYPLPNNPASLAVGDFNGDGLMDVAAGVTDTFSSAGSVYVFFGQADGTLGAPVMIDASVNPTGLAAADLNGDGRTDLVIADQGSSTPQVNGALHVYLGNADGTFTGAGALHTSATYYSAVAVGDLNGDGKPDLVVGGNVAGNYSGTPNIYTLLGNGDGTFQIAQVTPLAGTDGVGAQSLALGDFNGDGKVDVAVGNPNDYTELLLGYGDGTFANSLLALGQQPLGLGAVDLDGDGLPDLLIGGTGGLALFKNVAAWPTLP